MAEDVDYTAETANDDDLVKRLRAEIRARDERLAEAEGRAKTAQKASTFRALGINPDKGVGKLFFNAYEGDLTEDAIKAAATEYEVTIGEPQAPPAETPAPTQQQTPAPDPDAAAHAVMNQASAGAGPSGATPTSPDDAAWAAYHQTMNTTGNPDDAMANHFMAKFAAAAAQQSKRG